MEKTKEKTIKFPPQLQSHKYAMKWYKFHMANRWIMVRLANTLEKSWQENYRNVSVKNILHNMRREKIEQGKDVFKINDAIIGIYAHVLCYNYPKYRTMIKLKNLKLKNKPKNSRK
jgi:hypothetical protein